MLPWEPDTVSWLRAVALPWKPEWEDALVVGPFFTVCDVAVDTEGGLRMWGEETG